MIKRASQEVLSSTAYKERGQKLQQKANNLLKSGNTSCEYKEIRRKCEEILGFWEWEEVTPSWKLDGVTKNILDYPAACMSVGNTGQKCSFLPAGSDECKRNDCPY